MKKILIASLMSLVSLIAQAEIQATLDQTEIHLNQTVQLTLSQDKATDNGAPDLSALRQDFDILGTARQLNYSLINGQAQSTSQWVISLRAKKAGKINIPPIQWGQEKSQALSLTVLTTLSSQETSSSNSGNDLLLEAKVQKSSAYVNQEILYTVRLYNAKSVLDADYREPEINDALVVRLGEVPRYQTIKNHKNYMVTEQSYAIFPQKSGLLKIKAPVFSALLATVPEPLKVTDKTLELQIKAIPKAYQGKTWLPAKQIKISEHYENASQRLGQGSTLTRVIRIEGTGVPAQLLPDIKLDNTDAYQLYLEKGKEQNVIKQGGLVGSREIKMTYLFKQAGQLTLPEFQLPWFNTSTGKEETAILAPRSLVIQANLATSAQQPPQTVPVIQTTAITAPSSQGSIWPWILVLFLAIAWLLTIVLWGLQKCSSKSKNYKRALDELKTACLNGSPEKAHTALLHWASLYWPKDKILNLADIQKLSNDPSLQQELLQLSRDLYQEGAGQHWNGQRLFNAVMAFKPRAEKKPRGSPLSEINP